MPQGVTKIAVDAMVKGILLGGPRKYVSRHALNQMGLGEVAAFRRWLEGFETNVSDFVLLGLQSTYPAVGQALSGYLCEYPGKQVFHICAQSERELECVLPPELWVDAERVAHP
jgi:hypothetical protein